MTTFEIGLLYGGFTLLVMFSGMPIAFSLGLVATVFMVFFMPSAALDTVTQNVYEEMASITLLTIPLFILKGAAIGKSRAGLAPPYELLTIRFSCIRLPQRKLTSSLTATLPSQTT